MVYMGSKSKYAKHIVPVLQKCIDDNKATTYIECFVGGANIIDKIKARANAKKIKIYNERHIFGDGIDVQL